MKTPSLHDDRAIDLLSGYVGRSQSQVQAGTYRCTAYHIDHSLNAALCTTNSSGEQPQASCLQGPESWQKAVRIRQQNTSEKTCTNLATEHHFTGFSKDVFRRRAPAIFRGYQAGILTFPEQENGAENDKSVHRHFFKMPSRQDDQFFCRTGAAGEYKAGAFWFFIRLKQLMLSNTITQFDCSVQG